MRKPSSDRPNAKRPGSKAPAGNGGGRHQGKADGGTLRKAKGLRPANRQGRSRGSNNEAAAAKEHRPVRGAADKTDQKRQRRTSQSRQPVKIAASGPATQMRIAKAMARAGLCSRRDAERWIEEGRVAVNGKLIKSPALDVGPTDRIMVDGEPLPQAEPVRLWRYYKPKGMVTSHRDPQGRPTVFDNLPPEMPRVISIGRLDYNTEGLLLLTTDGALARHLELPSTGWLRRYRVRAHCTSRGITQDELNKLKDGTTVDGVTYGAIEATLDHVQGANVWLTIALREGKNREVRRVLMPMGLDVNRLIRVSYGPFQLLDMKPGTVEIVRRRVMRDQFSAALADQLGLLDDADEVAATAAPPVHAKPAAKPRRPDKKDRPKRLELVDGPRGHDRKKAPGGQKGRRPGAPGSRKPGGMKPGSVKSGRPKPRGTRS